MSDLLKITIFSLAVTLSVFLLARPWRRPYVVFVYSNRLMLKIALGLSIATMGFPWSLYLTSSLPIAIAEVIVLSTLFVASFVIIWIALDTFVFPYRRAPRIPGGAQRARLYARYQKDGKPEQITLGWAPDLVVDGVRYNVVGYRDTTASEDNLNEPMLAFDKQGRVVRDVMVMHKLTACLFLAEGVVLGRGYVKLREEAYPSAKWMVRTLKKGLADYDRLMAPLKALADPNEPEPRLRPEDYRTRPKPGRIRENIERVRRALEILLEFYQIMMQDMETMGKWERAQGYKRLRREIRYEDVLDLTRRLKGVPFIREHQLEIRMGWLAYRLLLNYVRDQYAGPRKDRQRVMALFAALHQATREVREVIELPKEWPHPLFRWMKDEEVACWRDRLAWYDRVEGWRAEGLTGLALERKKLQWQLAQEGLELTPQGRKRLQKKGLLPGNPSLEAQSTLISDERKRAIIQILKDLKGRYTWLIVLGFIVTVLGTLELLEGRTRDVRVVLEGLFAIFAGWAANQATNRKARRR